MVAKSVSLLAFGMALMAAAPALAQMNVKLAPGVLRGEDYAPPSEPYIAAADSPIYSAFDPYTKPTGQVTKRQKLDVLAEVHNHDWLLLGKDGVGVGYLPRSLATPEKYASELH